MTKNFLIKRIVLMAFCFANLLTYAETIDNRMDANVLGAWALKQHQSIGNKILEHLNDNKFKQSFLRDKPIAPAQALALFQTQVTAFISTDPNNPTIGHDTTFYELSQEPCFALYKAKQFIGIQLLERGALVNFDAKEVTSLLNSNELLYLQLYSNGEQCLLSNIPAKSFDLLMAVNIELYKASVIPGALVYKNIELSELMSEKEKLERGNDSSPVFISTDPDDPTIGYDSLLITPCLALLNDSSQMPLVYYTVNLTSKVIKLSGVSASFYGNIQGFKINFYFAFLPIEKLILEHKALQTLLEDCIVFHMQNNLSFSSPYKENYERLFKPSAKQ
jgi:hypothetical protein